MAHNDALLSLIGVFSGWVAVGEDIVNLNNGLRIRNTSYGRTPSIKIFYLNGDDEDYDGDEAQDVLDRLESYCAAAEILTGALDNLLPAAPAPAESVGEL